MILRNSFLMAVLYHCFLCDLEASTIYPKLEVSPEYHVYITGEAILMTCLVPEESRNGSITFYKDSNIISQNNLYYNISNLDNLHVGIYACMIKGIRSNEKAIHVHDPLPQPMILLEQPNMPEMPINVKCSTPGHCEWKHIRFFINGIEIFMATSSSKMAINEIRISVQRTAGVYSCNYEVQKLGRLIDSQPSESVHVSVLDSTTKSSTAISNAPTYETDRRVVTDTPTSYTSGATDTSTFQSYTVLKWKLQTNGINSSSNQNGLLTSVYYSIGCLLCALLVVLLIFLLCRFCLPIKRKRNRPAKTPFWMNYSTRKKSRKTSPSFQMPMIAHEKEEKNIYDQSDPCTTFMNPSSPLKPSAVHRADLHSNIYDSVQEAAPITSVYVTLETQKHL